MPTHQNARLWVAGFLKSATANAENDETTSLGFLLGKDTPINKTKTATLANVVYFPHVDERQSLLEVNLSAMQNVLARFDGFCVLAWFRYGGHPSPCLHDYNHHQRLQQQMEQVVGMVLSPDMDWQCFESENLRESLCQSESMSSQEHVEDRVAQNLEAQPVMIHEVLQGKHSKGHIISEHSAAHSARKSLEEVLDLVTGVNAECEDEELANAGATSAAVDIAVAEDAEWDKTELGQKFGHAVVNILDDPNQTDLQKALDVTEHLSKNGKSANIRIVLCSLLCQMHMLTSAC